MDWQGPFARGYAWFRLAKRLESFAYRCRWFEASLHRAADLIPALNRMLAGAGYAEGRIVLPADVPALERQIHWAFHEFFRSVVRECSELSGMTWVFPLSPANRDPGKLPGGRAALDRASLPGALLTVRTVLADLAEEAALIEEEHAGILRDWSGSEVPGIRGMMEALRQMAQTGWASGGGKDLPGTVKNPFRLVREAVTGELLPQLDALLTAWPRET